MNCTLVLGVCCLIDLEKGSLLHVLTKLPYHLLVPLPIRSEVSNFSDYDWCLLNTGGLETFDLPSDAVAAAMALREPQPHLSANDCFCLCSVHCLANVILITGDRLLRHVAVHQDLRVHGVLWISDQLQAQGTCSNELLIATLECWQDDPYVFLPPKEIASRLHKWNPVH